MEYLQARYRSLDDSLGLLLTPPEQSRHHHLRQLVLALVGPDELHQVCDGVVDVLDQDAAGFSCVSTLKKQIDFRFVIDERGASAPQKERKATSGNLHGQQNKHAPLLSSSKADAAHTHVAPFWRMIACPTSLNHLHGRQSSCWLTSRRSLRVSTANVSARPDSRKPARRDGESIACTIRTHIGMTN